MKVAIIQEWLVTVGGSDKVVKAIFDVFPNADMTNSAFLGSEYIHRLYKKCP